MADTSLFRPLNLAEQLTGEMGTAITYAYEDIVFTEHSEILLQFDANNADMMHLYIHDEIGGDEAQTIRDRWLQAARTKKISLQYKGTFTIEQSPGKEEVNIRFN